MNMYYNSPYAFFKFIFWEVKARLKKSNYARHLLIHLSKIKNILINDFW